MKLNKLAWRNLFRRKRRTAITAFSIGFGVMLSVTFTGTGDYIYTNMIDTGASMGMGHVTVQAMGYDLNPTLDKKVQRSRLLRQELLSMSEIKDVSIRLNGQAMFSSANRSVGGAFIAIDPTHEKPESNLLIRSIVVGSLFDASDQRGIVVGSKLAKKLNLKIGKKIVYTTTDVSGEMVSNMARVRGLFTTGMNMVDGAMVLLPLQRIQETLGYRSDEASLLAVMIDDQRHAENVRDLILAKLSTILKPQQATVLSWKEAQPDLFAVITMDKSMNYISQFLVGLLIAAGILNTMLMSVLERKREFGIMMAVGMSPRMLFQLVMVESFWLAVIGLLVGIVITAPWFYYLYYTGIDFSSAFGNDFSYGGVLVDPVIKARLFLESAIAILIGVFSLAITAGTYPAWKAGRESPIESLKEI
ncbi:MAG: FtsX-like permease family protein [Mariprofundaceae bacterium]